ncbi:UNVERIFIED_CONTAM: hypothetical protein FKN15_018701 [Acipenser sinensis]
MGNLASPPWRPRLTPSWGRVAATAPLPNQQQDRYLTSAPSFPPTCFRCQQLGHQARSCPSAVECEVAVCNWASEAEKHKERQTDEKWEEASMRQGWGLVGERLDGNKHQSKGVRTQCDREGEVTGPSRAEATPAPLNIPDMWHSSADIVWGQTNYHSRVQTWGQVWSIEG